MARPTFLTLTEPRLNVTTWRPEVHMIFCWAGSAAFLAARAAAEGGAAWLRTDWRVISPLSVAFALSVRARHRNDPCLELASSQ